MPMMRRTQPAISIFTVIAVFILICAVSAAGAVFIYQQYLIKQIESAEKELQAKEDELQTQQLAEWTTLDRKINAARQILSSHVAPSSVFRLLEENTLGNVRFTSFDLQKSTDDKAEAGSMKLILTGEAAQISTIVIQSDHFGSKSNIFMNPFFHNVASSETGLFTFDAEATIPAAELRYSKRFTPRENPETQTPNTVTEESLGEVPTEDDVTGGDTFEDISL
jgi:G3E family GTPase